MNVVPATASLHRTKFTPAVLLLTIWVCAVSWSGTAADSCHSWFAVPNAMATTANAPCDTLVASGVVLDMVLCDDVLVVGTDAGSADVFDVRSGTSICCIQLPTITDFFGDTMPPKIFSVDRLPGQEHQVLLVCEEKGGARSLTIANQAGQLRHIIPASAGLFMRKARFVDPDRVLVALLSNELLLVDVTTGETQYRVQVGLSSFSDFSLNDDHSLAAVADESGMITVLSVADGTIARVLEGGNRDNVYKVDFRGEVISTAGQDRQVAIYSLDRGVSRIESDFIVYAVGLSPTGARGAFSCGEDNDLAVYETASGTVSQVVTGARSTPNTLLFRDEQTLIAGSDDRTIMVWRLK